MKRILQLIKFFSVVALLLLAPSIAISQCTTCETPTTFNVNLTANPNMTWSNTSTRSGLCCGAVGTNCIKFNVTVSSGVGSVSFDVQNPGPPGGAFYQINCGAPTSLGTPFCVVGMSSFCIVFCKSGNDSPTYTIETHELVMVPLGTPVSCFGGSNGTSSVVVTGSGPFTYAWSPSGGTGTTASGLTAGTYTVNVSDLYGCINSATYTVAQPALLTATIESTDVTCKGTGDGIATVTAVGGNSSYTYLWSPSGGTGATATGLTPGNYTVTVNDVKLCQTTATININEPKALDAKISSSTNVTCFDGTDGSATSTVGDGTSPYTYFWNTSPVQTTAVASNIPSGTYTLTVTDANGCISNDIVTITEPPIISLTTSQTNVSCFNGSNGSASVTASGGKPGYNYNWIPSGGSASNATNLTAGTYTVIVTDSKGCTKNTTVTITQPTDLSLSFSSTNVSCFDGNNGSATVTVTGGNPGYTYSWAPAGGSIPLANNLIAGSYTVTVTDIKGCQKTGTAAVVQPIAMSTTMSSVNVSCNGGSNGSATVTVSGGVTPYSYLWSPGGSTAAAATGLTSGIYTIGITDNKGCVINRTVTITQPTSLSASVVVDNPSSCNAGNDGAATVTAAGGTTAYSYSWSTSPVQTSSTATGLSGGTYTVTVTDSKGCSAVAIAVIAQPPALSAIISSFNNVSCLNGTNGNATVNVGGGSPGYTYSWVPSGGSTSVGTNLAAGTYTVNITDVKGCAVSASVTITQPTLLSTNITATSVSCNGGSNGSATATSSGGTPGYTYLWSPSGGSSSLATGLTAGNYTVTATDSKGCQATATTVVSQPAGMTLTTSSVNATCSTANGQASVSANGGNPGYSYSWNSTPVQTTSTAGGLPAGAYIITVTDASGCSSAANVIVSNNAAPTASILSTINISCNGGSNGSATGTVIGGTSPYTYSWSPIGGSSITGTALSAGNYTLTVTDLNGCIATVTTAITQPTALNLSTSQTNVSCNGGTNGAATVIASGGTPGYLYNWSPSGGAAAAANNLSAGTYTVTVSDTKGCNATANVIITQPIVLAAVTSVNNNVSCNGGSNGSASASITGGTAGYTYSWSPTGGSSSTALGLFSGSYTVTITDSKGCQASATAAITQPSPIGIAISSTNVLCNGGNSGSATAIASNGTGPYTYFWTPIGINGSNASGLTVGTYTVIVTDANGCQASSSVTITQPSLLTVAMTTTNVSCFDGTNGSVNSTVAGGSIPYSYSWSTSPIQTGVNATGLSADNYTLTITDSKGCITATNVLVTQPSPISLTTSQTNVFCNGGSNGTASVVASGGTAGYTYNWSPSGGSAANANVLNAGIYTVTVTDTKGCTATATVTISEPTILTSSVTSSTNVSCNGGNNGTATVSTSGGTQGYTYLWAPTGGTSSIGTGLSAGSYTVTITDNKSCTSSSSVLITQPAVFSGSIVSVTNVSCSGGNNGSATVIGSGGTSPYSYSWSPFGGTAATANNLSDGTYTVTINDANTCSYSLTVIITQPLQLTAGITSTNVTCNGGNNGTVTATPAGGSAPYSYSWSTSPVQTTSSVVNLLAGTYTVTVTDGKGCTAVSAINITESPALFITSSQVNASCNGGNNGSSSVNVSGGTPGYTYNWAPSGGSTATGTGLSAGTYTVTVTDAAGCIGSSTVTITQPIILTSAITATTTVSCNGGNNGTATVTPSGGIPGYTYLWAPSGGTSSIGTGLSAGSYTVIITDSKSCTSSSTALITQPAGLSGSIVSVTNVSCNGGNNGSVTASGSGGTSPYSYSWLPFGGTAAIANGISAGTYTVTITDANSCTYSLPVTITQPVQLTAGITATNVACNGGNNGSATVIPAGGSSPYTYSWSTLPVQTSSSAINLFAGTYSVTVTDSKGCTAVSSINITESPALFITNTLVNVSCNGGNNGSSSVNVSGGTPGYTYNWVPSGGSTATGTGLSAGTYTVTLTDAAGCTGSSTVAITEPSPLSPTVIINNQVSCNGGTNGSATVTPSGGTPGYTFNWAPVGLSSATENNLSAGTYTITTADSKGCSAANTISITQPNALSITLSSVNISCNGGSDGSATVNVTGGTSPYTYQWLPSGGTAASATGLAAGTYTLTSNDAKGCSIISIVTIAQPVSLALTLTSSSNVTCFSSCNGAAQVTATGGTTPYSYSWAPGGQSSASVNNLCAGTHTVTVTDSKGCLNTITVTIVEPVSITTINTITNVTCFNACDGSATIVASGGAGPYSFLWNPGFQTTPSVAAMCAGTYTVTVTDANGCFIDVPIAITQPTATTLTITTTDANCLSNNGDACVAVAGGVSPYTYQWNDPLTQTTFCAANLTGNSYTVTVTDANGCLFQAAASVNNIGGPLVTIPTSTNITCAGSNNGTANASISLGTPPYTILWSPSGQSTAFATGLGNGINTITVTDNAGCVASASVTITKPAVLGSAVTSSTNITCNALCNGAATVAAGGGVSPYSYSWNSTPVQTTPTATGLCAGGYTVTITDANGCNAISNTTITQPSVILIATTSVVNVSCNGGNNGSIQVSVTGGTPGYTYLWSPSGGSGSLASGLSAGNYTLTVTDVNGCIETETYNISQPTVLSSSITQSDITCNGNNDGTASVIINGGSPGYTFSWSPSGGSSNSIINLSPGSYIVTATDTKGCIIKDTADINEPSLIVINTSTTQASCFGGSDGSATAIVSGGTTGYTYSWSTSPVQNTATAINIPAGSYTITVTDANVCSKTQTVNVLQNSEILVSSTSLPASCNGNSNGSVSAFVSGGTPGYSYLWIPGGATSSIVSGLPAGTYSVTVTDALGCTGTSTATVVEPTLLSASATIINTVSCNGGNNGALLGNATDGTPGYFYVWAPSGGTTPNAANLSAGTYTLTVIDSKNCQDTATVNITEPSVITASISQTNVSCFGGNNGSANAIVTGGTAGYTYLWSPTGGTNAFATGLTAGNYTLTVTDINSCSKDVAFVITEPAQIIINTSTSQVSCFGGNNGSASAFVSGGTTGYTYSWSTSPVQNTATAINVSAGSFTVTVTDANVCSKTQTVNVLQNSEMLVSSISLPASCNGNSNGSVSAFVSGGTPGYSYLWIPGGATSSIVSGLPAGTYSVTVTDALGCTGTSTATVVEPTLLSASAIVVSNVSCIGGMDGALLGNATGGTPGYFYVWTPSGGTAASASNLSSGAYTLTVIDSKNCQDTATVNITEPSIISTSITQTNVSCFGGNNGSGSAIVTGGTAGYTYLWSPTGGTNAFATGLTAGNYTLTVTDINSCSKDVMITISQPQLLLSSISANTNLSCFGSCDGTAIATATNGTGPYSYLWLPVNISSASVNNLCAGSYTVIATDDNGCQTTDSIIINQPAAISNVVSSNNVTCFGSCNGDAGIVTTGGVGPYTFLWNPGGQTTPSVSNLCENTYTVTVTDNNGCTQNAVIIISEPTDILDTIAVTSSTCGNSNGLLTTTTSGGTPPYLYQWNDPLLQTSASATNLSAGNYAVIITDANGCTYTENAVVPGTITPSITSINGVSPSCYGTPTGSANVFVSGGTSPYTYLWNDAFNQTNSTATGIVAGTYIVIVTDNNGCTATDSITLNQPSQIQTVISANDSILCYGQSAQLFSSGVGGNPGYTYYWNTGFIGAGPVTYSPASTTIFSVYAVDASGCQSLPASITVTVGSPITTTAPDVSACEGQTSILSANAVGGNNGPYTYTWSNGPVGQNQSVVLFSDQTYFVTVGDGCSSLAFDTVVVTVYPVAIGSIILSDTSGCEPFTIQVSGSSDIGTSYSWNFGDTPLNVAGENVSHTYNATGSYWVTMTVTTANGCNSVLENIQPVNVKQSPTADFTVSPSITPLANVTDINFTNLSTGAISYIWSFGDGNTSTAVNPAHYYALTGEYLMQLVAINPFGCTDTFSLKSTSENYIHFANAFTPNINGGNGGTYNFVDLNNDVFFPTSSGVTEYHLVIYNKWGEAIFESNDINIGWDGYYKGKICKQDVYVWKAFATFKDGSKYVGMGDVTLLR